MFYACEWVLEKKGVSEIEKLYDAAADLNCLIWNVSFFTPDGFKAARFIIQVPSLTLMETFTNNTANLIFKNWKPIELKPEETPPLDLDPKFRLSQLSGNVQTSFFGGFFEYAAYNEMLKERNNKSAI